MDLSERIKKYLTKCDPAVSGSGGHNTTFQVACKLVKGFDLSPGQALSYLQDWNQKCQPHWSDKELLHKVNEANKAADEKPRGFLLNSNRSFKNEKNYQFKKNKNFQKNSKDIINSESKPKFCRAALENFCEKIDKISDFKVSRTTLALKSTHDPANLNANSFLNLLYNQGEKVLIFTNFFSQGDFVFHREKFSYVTKADGKTLADIPEVNFKGVWFLANPVDGKFYISENSKKSRRTWKSVTSWRYMVLESDEKGIAQLWLKAICHMPLPIKAIYTSGKKSIHCLLAVKADSKPEFDFFRKQAIETLSSIGADPSAITGVRLTRLPFCSRMESHRLQRLLYFCASPRNISIADRPKQMFEPPELWKAYAGNFIKNRIQTLKPMAVKKYKAKLFFGLRHYGLKNEIENLQIALKQNE